MAEPNNDDKVDPATARRSRLTNRWRNSEVQEPQPQGAGPTDPDDKKEETVQSAVADPPNAEEQQKPARQPRGKVAGKEKLQPYVTEEIAERARNAWWRTRSNDDGYETFSDLIEAAILAKVEEMENHFNGGQPFEPRPRKRLSSGRPIGR